MRGHLYVYVVSIVFLSNIILILFTGKLMIELNYSINKKYLFFNY